MAKTELNLLQFAGGGAAEPSTASTEIVRCDSGNANLGGELLDDVPDQLFPYSFAPSSTGATSHAGRAFPRHSGGVCPFVQQAMFPIRDGNSSNVTSLSAQEARHRRREDAPGGRRTCVPAELPGVVLSAFEHRLDRTAYRRDTACREPSSWYTKRATSARCGTVTRGVLRPCRGRDPL
jgi:hypothetical protein